MPALDAVEWVHPRGVGDQFVVNVHTLPYVNIRYVVRNEVANDSMQFLNELFVMAANGTIRRAAFLWRNHGLRVSFPAHNPACQIRAFCSGGDRRFAMNWAMLDEAVAAFEAGVDIAANSFKAEDWNLLQDRGISVYLRFMVVGDNVEEEDFQFDAIGGDQDEDLGGGGGGEDFFNPPPPQNRPPRRVRFIDPEPRPVFRMQVRTRAQIQREMEERQARQLRIQQERGGLLRSGTRYLTPQGFHGGARFGSPYSEWKKRRIAKKGLQDEFFKMTDQCIFTPHTEEGLCFVMAFMKAQLRAYEHLIQEGPPDPPEDYVPVILPQIREVLSTKATETGLRFQPMDVDKIYFQMTPILVPIEELSPDFLDEDFLASSTQEGMAEVVLFNPFKKKLQDHSDMQEFCMGFTQDYVLDWILAARALHMFVEQKLNRPVDWTYEEDVCVAYAEVFDVNIHLYTNVAGGRRYRTFGCSNMDRHVHLVNEDTHVCAVTNVQAFMAQHSGSMKVSPHNFCDICTLTTTNDNFKKQEGLKHIEFCCDVNKSFKVAELNKSYGELTKTMHSVRYVSKQLKFRCLECGSLSLKKKKVCDIEGHMVEPCELMSCSQCNEDLEGQEVGLHQCYIQTPELKDPIDVRCLWAYDVEAMQVEVLSNRTDDSGRPCSIFTHECNCMFMRRVYEDVPHETKQYFKNIDEFLECVLKEARFDGAFFYAHNAASYDSQYILRYAEEHGVVHEFIPHPNSNNKYLELKLISERGAPIYFRDFRPLVPGSLKGIGESFGLSVTKGDFPHGFNTPGNQQYIGPIPALQSPEDYYGYEVKKEKRDQEALMRWYQGELQTVCSCAYVPGEYVFSPDPHGVNRCAQCSKCCWNFQEELRKYCYLDVVVLAESMKLYRETMLAPSKDPYVLNWDTDDSGDPWQYWVCRAVDPFNYLTASQIAMTLFLAGFHPNKPLRIASTQYSHRDNYNPVSAGWIQKLNRRESSDDQIVYRGNSIREYYSAVTHKFYDGYQRRTKKIFIFRDCAYYACTCQGYNQTDKHRTRNMEVAQIWRDVRVEVWRLEQAGYQVVEMREHMISGEVLPLRLIQDREMLYGGRTEVHHAYMKPQEGEEIIYDDVCSMYPWVCAQKPLPIGHPQVLIGDQLDLRRLHYAHPNRYWGYVLATVVPARSDKLGLLPSRDPDTHRLEFNLHPKTCVWFTEEIYLAQENGYEVTELLHVYHWKEEDRCDSVFRGFVSYFLKQKQEADGWKKAGGSSADPPLDEKERLIQSLYEENGNIGRMEIDKVGVNPVKRALAKLNLNSLWGKFVQGRHDDHFVGINGYRQYMQFMAHPNLNLATVEFRHVKDNYFKVKYNKISDVKPNRNNYNCFLGSSVTAWSRIKLNSRCLEIGADNLIYTDTDSMIYVRRIVENEVRRKGLGHWQNEKPGEVIRSVTALAPKNYALEIGDELEAKSKGVVLHVKNKRILTRELLDRMLGELVQVHPTGERMQEVRMDNFNIYSNSTNPEMPYAQLCSRINTKVYRPVLSKRKLVKVYNRDEEGQIHEVHLGENLKKIRLLPFGHELLERFEDAEELSNAVYGDVFRSNSN